MKSTTISLILCIALLFFGCSNPAGGGASETIARVIISDTVAAVSIQGTHAGDYTVLLCNKTYFPLTDTGFADSGLITPSTPSLKFTKSTPGIYNIVIASKDSAISVMFSNMNLIAAAHDTLVDTLRPMSSIGGHLFILKNSQKTIPAPGWYAFIRGTQYIAGVDQTGYFQVNNMAKGTFNLVFDSNQRYDKSTSADTTVNLPAGELLNNLEIIIP